MTLVSVVKNPSPSLVGVSCSMANSFETCAKALDAKLRKLSSFSTTVAVLLSWSELFIYISGTTFFFLCKYICIITCVVDVYKLDIYRSFYNRSNSVSSSFGKHFIVIRVSSSEHSLLHIT